MFVYWSDSTIMMKSLGQKISRVWPFIQSDLVDGHRVIRRHGPQSIAMGGRLLT
jgi:hypothetical protein